MTRAASVVRPAKGAVSRVTEHEALVLDLGSDRFFRLDAVGARAWALIVEVRTFQEIVAGVVAEFEVEPDRAREDLERLLVELAALGVIEIDDAPA